MKRWLGLALGVVTSFGGFLEIGSIATAAQAGADYHYQLVWAVVLGTLCIALLIEMSGRFAAVSKHTIADAMRERFGLHFFMVPLTLIFLVSLLVLAAEIGGVAVALATFCLVTDTVDTSPESSRSDQPHPLATAGTTADPA